MDQLVTKSVVFAKAWFVIKLLDCVARRVRMDIGEQAATLHAFIQDVKPALEVPVYVKHANKDSMGPTVIKHAANFAHQIMLVS